MKYKGFTLAEILVTLLILAVLSTITINATSKMMPNKSMMIFKKSYTVLNNAINELINDNDLYPKYISKDPLNPDKYAGFRATGNYVNVPGTFFNGTSDQTNGGEKFARLLAAKLNAEELEDNELNSYCPTGTNVCVLKACSSNTDCIYNEDKRVQFTTPDGVTWEASTESFKEKDNIVAIDINGNNSPNCSFDDAGCLQPDRFRFVVKYDGNISFLSEQEKEYLTSLKMNSED